MCRCIKFITHLKTFYSSALSIFIRIIVGFITNKIIAIYIGLYSAMYMQKDAFKVKAAATTANIALNAGLIPMIGISGAAI